MSPRRVLAAAAIALGTLPVWSQTPEEPERGVARISVINGDVSVRRGDSGDYVAAALNAPLVVQDRVLTGNSSRSEVQFDWANFLRLSRNAEVHLAELEHRRYLVQVARGTVTWRVLRDHDASVEISTPSVSVRPARRGTYRVTVLEDGSSEITVRSGEAEIYTPRGSERLPSGRTMFARGTSSDPEYRIDGAMPEDEWDQWNIARDRDLERSHSYRYMSRDIYGAEDLDRHGRWVNASSYGWVWAPSVAAGWAPYRHGRWVWMDWYGWTWVSYDPWGWAPYHYGRWFWHAPVGWCWWPGAVGRRHYWSPGLVAFVGFGRASVGVGWGRVGWIPLGPREPFHPWWGRGWYGGGGYAGNRVTVVNNVNITNVYRNARITNGITVVDHDGFRRGRFDHPIRIGSDDLRSASLARGPLPVPPGRESLRLADRDATVRGLDRGTPDRFFSRSTPPQVQRVSFEEQQRGIERIARRSFGEPAGRSLVDSGTDRAPAAAAASGATRSLVDGGGQRGWRRADETPGAVRSLADQGTRAGTPAAERGLATQGGETGWRRFGGAVANQGGAPSAGEPEGRRRVDAGRTIDGPARQGLGAGGTDWRRSGGRAVDAAPSVRGEQEAGRSSERSIVDQGRGTEWRRFGSGSVGAVPAGRGEPAVGRAVDAGAPTAERSIVDQGQGTDWRRFGSPRIEGDAGRSDGTVRSFGEPRGIDSSTGRTSGWRRFESNGAAPQTLDSNPGDRSGAASERNWNGRSDSRSWDRGESIRISPPIVRERGDSGGSMGRGSVDQGPRGGRSFDGFRGAPSGGTGMRGGGGGGRAPSGGSGGGGAGGRSGGGGGGRSGGSRGR